MQSRWVALACTVMEGGMYGEEQTEGKARRRGKAVAGRDGVGSNTEPGKRKADLSASGEEEKDLQKIYKKAVEGVDNTKLSAVGLRTFPYALRSAAAFFPLDPVGLNEQLFLVGLT